MAARAGVAGRLFILRKYPYNRFLLYITAYKNIKAIQKLLHAGQGFMKRRRLDIVGLYYGGFITEIHLPIYPP